MRWRMIAHAIDRERVIACGGVNIFGDPKADCWIMGFNPEPFWSEASRMNIARDAAAWAQVIWQSRLKTTRSFFFKRLKNKKQKIYSFRLNQMPFCFN